MIGASGMMVFGVALIVVAALISLSLIVAAGEMLWQWRDRRHAHPRAIDIELYRSNHRPPKKRP